MPALVVKTDANSRQHPIAATHFQTVSIGLAKVRVEVESGYPLDFTYADLIAPRVIADIGTIWNDEASHFVPTDINDDLV